MKKREFFSTLWSDLSRVLVSKSHLAPFYPLHPMYTHVDPSEYLPVSPEYGEQEVIWNRSGCTHIKCRQDKAQWKH